jgi:hypothetical protein
MRPPAKPTTEEEESFMKSLLNNVDASFLKANAIAHDTTPARNATRHSAKHPENASHDTLIVLGESKKGAFVAEPHSAGGLMSSLRGKCSNIVDIRDIDMDALCDGADDWDWKDIDSDDSIRPSEVYFSSIFSELQCSHASEFSRPSIPSTASCSRNMHTL